MKKFDLSKVITYLNINHGRILYISKKKKRIWKDVYVFIYIDLIFLTQK